MSSSIPDPFTAAVLTISDSVASGGRVDMSGPAVSDLLRGKQFAVVTMNAVPDEQPGIEQSIVRLAGIARLVVTTGGTGIAVRDVTPEATMAVCDRLLPGVAEKMRSEGARKTPFAVLSRGVCGTVGKSLILNLPGSPKGAIESLEAVIDLLPHALELLSGNTRH